MLSTTQVSGSAGANALSIAIIGPDEERRKMITSALAGCEDGAVHGAKQFKAGMAIQEFSSYPSDFDELPEMLAQNYDLVLIDLDSDQEFALKAVERIGSNRSATAVVYSAQADRNLVIRCMRAGAREFLGLPLAPGDMAGALARVSTRDFAMRDTGGTKRLFVFLGAKGGCGVTTVATSFAVSLARDSGQSTLLIDLGSPLGDTAIHLGTVHEYSTVNAFEDFSRLDTSFLRSLVGKHASGLSVLAGPADFPRTQAPIEAIDKLLAVARRSFHYVVVDAGSGFDLRNSSLFEDSADTYLVTQVGISELRNANRLISQFFSPLCAKLQIVLNRYTPRSLGIDDDHVAKALNRPAQWKIPDDGGSEPRAQRTITQMAQEGSPSARAIRQMARAACGLPTLQDRKKAFSLFG
jgi:pilus assembly protein CpaE